MPSGGLWSHTRTGGEFLERMLSLSLDEDVDVDVDDKEGLWSHTRTGGGFLERWCLIKRRIHFGKR